MDTRSYRRSQRLVENTACEKIMGDRQSKEEGDRGECREEVSNDRW